jgi:beta-lactamase regulating signal transducer with metallopeptidase domain
MFLLGVPGWAAPLGWALLHFLWQGTLVALALALLLRLTPRSEARYLFSCGALALCLALPCGTLAYQVRAQTQGEGPVAGSEGAAPSMEPAPAGEAPPASRLLTLERAVRARLPLVVALWALGCLLGALRLGCGWALAGSWRRRGFAPPRGWDARLADLSARMGLGGTVLLLASDRVDTPLAMGVLKSVILVPSALFTGMAPDLLEALLAHELAHVLRHDYLANLLQNGIEIVLFYHPAVWWISRRIRVEREVLADGHAAKVLGEPRRLALALNALDDLQPPFTTPALAASGGELMSRIKNPINPPKDLGRCRTAAAWAAPALLAVILLCPLAAGHAQAAGAQENQPGSSSSNAPSLPQGLPVPGSKISQAYGEHPAKAGTAAPSTFHPGIDLKAKAGAPVLATAGGTVLLAGPRGDHGIMVILQHGGGFETSYAHLASVCVEVGQRVAAGDRIGNVGRTGLATGPHLHYEIRKDGGPVDPRTFLASRKG